MFDFHDILHIHVMILSVSLVLFLNVMLHKNVTPFHLNNIKEKLERKENIHYYLPEWSFMQSVISDPRELKYQP